MHPLNFSKILTGMTHLLTMARVALPYQVSNRNQIANFQALPLRSKNFTLTRKKVTSSVATMNNFLELKI